MIKRFSCLILSIIMLLSMTACSSGSKKENTNINNPITQTSVGEYILTTTTGEVSMFDNSGNIISTVSLGGTPESEYIYVLDEGKIYLSALQNLSKIPRVMYAVDKVTRKLTMLSIYDTSIIKVAEMILSDGDITNMYGYNGLFYYSVNTQNLDAYEYSFERRQKLNDDGSISYIQTVPLENTEESTFIYMENYFSEYLEATGLNQYISPISDAVLLNIPKTKHAIYEIPTKVKDWNVNSTNIYFFADSQMGKYNIVNNKITVYYGPINPIDVQYIDGIDKHNFVLSDFGDNSKKTVLFELEYKDMKIQEAIQVNYTNAMKMNVEKDKYIMMLFKVTNSSKTFSHLRVMNYEDLSELYVIGIDYLPTKVLANGDTAYLFNPYEPYFLTGSIHGGTFSKISKQLDSGDVYSDIFLVNLRYDSDYYYDEYGRYMNKNNHLINEDGELIDENNDRVNILGQRINVLGQAINKEGELIDRFNNIIDENGKVLQYNKNADGYYYNSAGEKVDIDGTVLVRNSQGDWVRPEDSDEVEINITGHYDEFGNFIIDKDILELYPNAYELWQEQIEKELANQN